MSDRHPNDIDDRYERADEGELPDFTGIYKGRMLAELAYLSMTLAALDGVHESMESAIGFTEPKLRATEEEFRRLLQQNIMYVAREISSQATLRTPPTPANRKDGD